MVKFHPRARRSSGERIDHVRKCLGAQIQQIYWFLTRSAKKIVRVVDRVYYNEMSVLVCRSIFLYH